MVYQIYYGDKRPGETLFDIEYYLIVSDKEKDKWMVELHSLSFISGAVHFICNELKPELRDDFIKDCGELEELRGWIWETHRNYPRDMYEASKDQVEWGKHIEERIKSFCNKYGLYLNID